jgi:hypothetical protein
MTKEQFLEGTPFYIGGKRYAGDSTYSYSEAPGCICKQSRSSINEKVVINDYECNISKLGKTGFIGFTHVMGKKVVINLKFDNLVPYEAEVPMGE